ncbi:MAG: hypothetical protein AB3X46_09190 [Leptothrix ochracea]|uniref:hypothetical protein n=1 Tax=Leptothrix ochracea TaxID=735331 RepID=UPI0034E2FF54
MQMASLVGKQEQDLGQAGMSAASHIQRVIDEHRATVNEADQKTRVANLSASLQELLRAPDTGYLSAQGGDAVERFKPTRERINQIADAFGQDITDPAMQQQYKLLAQHQVQIATGVAMEHASAQTKAYELSASKLRLKVEGDGAVLAFNPIEKAVNTEFKSRMAAATVELADQAHRHFGYANGSPELAAYVAQGVGAIKADLIDHLVASDQVGAAERVLKSMKEQGELDPKVSDHLTQLISAGKVKTEGLSLALKTRDEASTLAEQEKILDRKYKDGELGQGQKAYEVHAIALAHLRADEHQRVEQQTQADNATLGRMFKAKLDNPNMTIGQVPASIMARASQDIHYAKALEGIFAQASGAEAMSPEAQVAYLNAMTHVGDGSALDISLQPDTERFKLYAAIGQKAYMDHVLPQIRQAEKNEGRPGNDPNVLPLKFVKPAIDRMLAETEDTGLMKSSGKDADLPRRAAVTQFAHTSLLFAQQQAGHVFSESEVADHLNKLAASDIEMRRHIMGIPLGETRGRMLATKFNDIPAPAVGGITKALRERGVVNPTESQVLTEYLATYDRILRPGKKPSKPAGTTPNPFGP